MNELLEPPGSANIARYPRTMAVVYNLRPEMVGDRDDLFEEYDSFATVESLSQEISALGFEPILIEQDHLFLSNLETTRPDFVFNLAEGKGNSRGRESQVPSVLESLSIPFTGSDSVALAVSLDKLLTNRALLSESVPVPEMACFRDKSDLSKCSRMFFKKNNWVIKPRWEGSSKGVFNDSVASSPEDMAVKVRRIWEMYHQPALAEAFLPGDEYTVGVVGNEHPRVLGMMRISCPSQTGPFIYSLENKRAWEGRILYEGPDTIAQGLKKRLERAAIDAFRALELRDISRIDFRLDDDGHPKVIDVNPLPGMSPAYSDLPILCRLSGTSYPELVHHIVEAALSRNGAAMPFAEQETCAASAL